VKGSFKSQDNTPAQLTPEQFTAYKNQLTQRAELVVDGLVGLGLKARILGEEELNALFFSVYNPDSEGGGVQAPAK
jgi:hypothetical protein